MLSSTAHEVDDADGPADKLQPTYSDNKPIKWVKGSNPAHLPGILYELERFYIRKGFFQPLVTFFDKRAQDVQPWKFEIWFVFDIRIELI